jgi:putative ferrous iron transport protein C
MILSELSRYLEQRGHATLADLSCRFHTSPDAMRGMLDLLCRKGKVARDTARPSCGTRCTSCAPETVEVYRWRGAVDIPIAPGCAKEQPHRA